MFLLLCAVDDLFSLVVLVSAALNVYLNSLQCDDKSRH